MSPTAGQLEGAAAAALSTVSVSDVANFVEFFVKLVGGHAQARDYIDASERAVQEALDIAEEVRISQEPNP